MSGLAGEHCISMSKVHIPFLDGIKKKLTKLTNLSMGHKTSEYITIRVYNIGINITSFIKLKKINE